MFKDEGEIEVEKVGNDRNGEKKERSKEWKVDRLKK